MTETLTPFDQTKIFLKTDAVASFIAGGFAGAVSRTVVSPFERAKILFQVQGPGQASYNGMFPTIYRMWKEEGTKGLFRGNGLNCIRIFPYSAVQFYVYQGIKNYFLQGDKTELENWQRLFAGGVCGGASVLATYPMDLVRARLSIQTASLSKLNRAKVTEGQKPPGMFSTLSHIYKNEGGFFALYRGMWPTTIGVVPYVGIQFAVYEQLKEWVPNAGNFSKLAMGAISGGVAQSIMYPFDLLRRRFQVLAMGNSELGFKYNGVADALKQIAQKEGIKGLYKGLTANLFKVIPSTAVSWLVYEVVKDWMVHSL